MKRTVFDLERRVGSHVTTKSSSVSSTTMLISSLGSVKRMYRVWCGYNVTIIKELPPGSGSIRFITLHLRESSHAMDLPLESTSPKCTK